MNDTGAAGQTPSTTATTRKRLLSIALWTLQVVLALTFAMAGFAKVGGDAAMVEMFATIAIGQWFRYLVGALEIAGALEGVMNFDSGTVASRYGYKKTIPQRRFRRRVGVRRPVSGARPGGRTPARARPA